jgi:beta-galactosidase
VWLQIQEPPTPVEWQRSVFNGLAQILVQSTGEPGTIRLTARAAGLQFCTREIEATPGLLRPRMP